MKNMHKKKFSRDLYADLKEADLLPQEFARKHVDQATWELEARVKDYDPLELLYPNSDAFLQWTQEHGLVERVRKGVYRFVQEEPEEVEEVPEEVVVTDMDPEHPMILDLTIHNVPRLPRKMKKRVKRELIRNTGAKKVGLTFVPEVQ